MQITKKELENIIIDIENVINEYQAQTLQGQNKKYAKRPHHWEKAEELYNKLDHFRLKLSLNNLEKSKNELYDLIKPFADPEKPAHIWQKKKPVGGKNLQAGLLAIENFSVFLEEMKEKTNNKKNANSAAPIEKYEPLIKPAAHDKNDTKAHSTSKLKVRLTNKIARPEVDSIKQPEANDAQQLEIDSAKTDKQAQEKDSPEDKYEEIIKINESCIPVKDSNEQFTSTVPVLKRSTSIASFFADKNYQMEAVTKEAENEAKVAPKISIPGK